MVFEQHQATIPFIREDHPGIPRGISVKRNGSSGSEDEESSDAYAFTRRGSNSISRNPSTRDVGDFSPNLDLQFTLQTVGKKVRQQHHKSADELFAKGQILPLKPPPRLRSIKQLMAPNAAEGALNNFNTPCRTPGHSFHKDGLRTPTRSFRKDGLKAYIASSSRREKQGELAITMLGFEEWPKDENWKDGSGHGRTSSLRKLSTLFRKKYGKEDKDDSENRNLDGNASSRKIGMSGEKRRPFDSMSSRTLDGSNGKDDFFGSSRGKFDVDAKSYYFNISERTILEEEPEDHHEEIPETPHKKKQGRLSRFFTKKPSRLSAVAPSPSTEGHELKVKRLQNTSLLKMCLSNGIGQTLICGVKH